MNEKEYIRVLKHIYDGANEYTIKVWTDEPSYSNIKRTIRLIKSYGYSEIFYTCSFDDNTMIKRLGFNSDIKIYDNSDYVQKCIDINRLDLLKIIEKGI